MWTPGHCGRHGTRSSSNTKRSGTDTSIVSAFANRRGVELLLDMLPRRLCPMIFWQTLHQLVHVSEHRKSVITPGITSGRDSGRDQFGGALGIALNLRRMRSSISFPAVPPAGLARALFALYQRLPVDFMLTWRFRP
jgi:hypothetical protein